MLPKNLRVTSDFEYNLVRKYGKAAHTPLFILSVAKDLKNPDALPRFGIIVSNNIDKRSVVRHRIKRLLSKLFEENREKFNKGTFVVLVAKMGIVGKNYEEFSAEFNKALPKILVP